MEMKKGKKKKKRWSFGSTVRVGGLGGHKSNVKVAVFPACTAAGGGLRSPASSRCVSDEEKEADYKTFIFFLAVTDG